VEFLHGVHTCKSTECAIVLLHPLFVWANCERVKGYDHSGHLTVSSWSVYDSFLFQVCKFVTLFICYLCSSQCYHVVFGVRTYNSAFFQLTCSYRLCAFIKLHHYLFAEELLCKLCFPVALLMVCAI
jgi:hypothetical protein